MLEEVKSYLRIDGSEEDSFLASLISAAKIYIKNATGLEIVENPTDKLQMLAVSMLVTHWWENREPVGSAKELAFSLQSIFIQMQYCYGDTP